MSKIHIEHAHCLTKEEARERLAGLIGDVSDKYGVATEWTSEVEANFSRTGLTGALSLADGVVRIEMNLAYAMSPLTGTIERHVKGWLARDLAKRQSQKEAKTTMKEYKLLVDDDSRTEDFMNELAAQGWKLHSVIPGLCWGDDWRWPQLIMERDKPNEANG